MKSIFTRVNNQGGFTLLEVVFTGIVVIASIFVIVTTFDVAVKTLIFTQTRSIATELANEEMEAVRTKDYEQIYNENPTLSGGQWPDDPDLETSTSPPRYKDFDEYGYTVMRTLITTDTTDTSYLGIDVEKNVTRRNQAFKVLTYALWVQDSTDTQAFKRVVIKVSWETPAPENQVVVATDISKEDASEPRPSVNIAGIEASTYNVYSDQYGVVLLGTDDAVRDGLTSNGESKTNVTVKARARVNSARASGINYVTFTLISPQGVDLASFTDTTDTDGGGFYTYTFNSAAYPDAKGYYIKAEAHDSLGNKDVSSMRFTIDNMLPSNPSGVDAFNLTIQRVVIKWQWSGDNLTADKARFVIRRKVATAPDSSYIRLAVVSASGAFNPGDNYYYFQDVDVDPNTDYRYRVRAYDGAGNKSSEAVEKGKDKNNQTPVDTTPPSLPSPFQFWGIPTSWKANNIWWTRFTDENGIGGYYLYSTDSSTTPNVVVGLTPGTLVATDTLFYQDTELWGGRTYRYRIRAFDNEGNLSDYTSSISVTTPMK